MTTHYRFTEHIEGSPEQIFALVSDMPNYGHWLPGSPAFGSTTRVSPYPVCLGTTYLDAGPLGERPGSVTAFDPPKYIEFHHTQLLGRGPLRATVDVHASYRLEQEQHTTCVVRDLDLAIEAHGLAGLATPLIAYAFRRENLRTMTALKRYVEAQGAISQ